MGGKLVHLKSVSQKKTKTVVDTIEFTLKHIESWEAPPFQRPIRINERVKQLAEQIIVDGGVLPGVLTLGVLEGKTYIVDGQHRIEAFKLSGVEVGFSDVRRHYFQNMGDMSEEFVNLNSQLARMRPDDILRGLEASTPALLEIRKRCPFVGYDMIRRGSNSPLLSMSTLLRTWRGSVHNCPAPGGTSRDCVEGMTTEETVMLIRFLQLADKAFGRDSGYSNLWGMLNLILCMWFYRRVVRAVWSAKIPQMKEEMFLKCLMSLSADTHYVDWLRGRKLGDRDRSPTWNKIKSIFVQRIAEETGKRPLMPQPEWAS